MSYKLKKGQVRLKSPTELRNLREGDIVGIDDYYKGKVLYMTKNGPRTEIIYHHHVPVIGNEHVLTGTVWRNHMKSHTYWREGTTRELEISKNYAV